MKRRNATRNALLMSVLSMLLCVSMLVGTTFAWFTDSVTSANNIIKSGNLDIELEYWNGTEWVDVEDKSDILTNDLWEPGVTEVAYFRLANVGSLALKYQFGINIQSEKAGVNQAGEEFNLSDYIQFGVVENVNGENGAYDTRDDAIAALTDAKPLNAGYTKANSMLADAEELYLALVVYMPTTVGNEANHKTSEDAAAPDKYRPEINLGINVLATQYNWEEEKDSFDHNYDENAEYPVMNVADLKDALKNKENVTLGDDVKIDTNEDSESNSYGKTGLNITDGQIFDGNGNTLSVDGADGTWDSAVSITSGTIKNLTIDSGFRGVFVNHNGTAGHVTLQNVIIDGPTYTISCDQGTGNGLTAIDSTFNGWTSYAATIGNVEFEGCSFGAGAVYAFCRPYAPTSFVNCNFAAGYQMDARAAVTFENCTIDGVALTAENLATLVTGNTANATVK